MSAADDRLRIGDAERERAQAALADHYAAGRLDHDEYSERLDRIWAARTGSDLRPVFADLPGSRPAARPAYSVPADRVATRRPRPARRLPAPLLLVLAALVALTVVTHLPLILIGLAVWFLFFRAGCGPRRRSRPRGSWQHS